MFLPFSSLFFCAEVIILNSFIRVDLFNYFFFWFETVISNFQARRFLSILGRPDYPSYLETPSLFCLLSYMLSRNEGTGEGKLNSDKKLV